MARHRDQVDQGPLLLPFVIHELIKIALPLDGAEASVLRRVACFLAPPAELN